MILTARIKQITEDVMRLTALLGRNRNRMDVIAVKPENVPILGILIGEAVTEAENELRRHLKGSSDFSIYTIATGGTEEIRLEMAERKRFARNTKKQMESSLSLYVTHYVMSRWVESIEEAKDLTEGYRTSAGGYLEKLASLACQREAFAVHEDNYGNRQTDNSTTGNDMTNLNTELYHQRRKDMQPIICRWPEGVMLTEGESIPTDSDNHILVSKSNPKEDEHIH